MNGRRERDDENESDDERLEYEAIDQRPNACCTTEGTVANTPSSANEGSQSDKLVGSGRHPNRVGTTIVGGTSQC